MRKLLFVLIGALVALPAAAQNVDIESLSGLQFNFGNPGARSLGMGGAFLGLADDASAAEANPAGLTILRKPEITVEGRNYVEQQVLTTSGVFPEVERTAFRNYSDRAVISFASFVYPIKNKVTLGAYYHEPLRNTGGGAVFPTFSDFTGRIEKNTPVFYFGRNGDHALSEEECDQILATDPSGCLRYDINPFISALDVKERTWGVAAAFQVHPRFSIGATARYQTFEEGAFTFRFTPYPDFIPDSISVQATAQVNDKGGVDIKQQNDLTFATGFKWTPTDKISIGGVYKQGAQFDTPTFVAGPATDFEYVLLAETKFHMPDSMGLGVSVRPIPTLTVNADAVHVKYSNLVDDFVATIANIEEIGAPFVADDVTELHLGAEYFFTTKIPFALRAGFWRDPAHSVEWRGPVNRPDYVAEALLYPKGEAQNHFSIGAGLAWPRFQIDVAYDSADAYKVGSVSMVTRF